MRYLAEIALAILITIAADGGIYTYAFHERPQPLWVCGFRYVGQREKEAADARFESHAIGAAAIFVNGAVFTSICATLNRRRRDKEQLAGH